jgi:vacuolar iron transporter family protein
VTAQVHGPGASPAPGAEPHGEPHAGGVTGLLNNLRAGVLGANDGIVSTAGLVVGVAGASTDRTALLVAGIAGLVAGSLSMAGGEYVSVSSQRDSQHALVAKERHELATMPQEELRELAELYEAKGLSPQLALRVATELTEHDALRAHVETELGFDLNEVASPIGAALWSLVSFAVGALLPLLAVVLPPAGARVPVTVAAVTAALAVTGAVSARLGQAAPRRAVLRNVVTGLLAMGVTYAVGQLVGATAL